MPITIKLLFKCTLVLFIVINTSNASDRNKKSEIFENLITNNCEKFLYDGYHESEASAAVVVSEKCSIRYFDLNSVFFSKDEFLDYSIKLSMSNRTIALNRFLPIAFEKFDNSFAIKVINAGCTLGGEITWYEEAYKNRFGDNEILSELCY